MFPSDQKAIALALVVGSFLVLTFIPPTAFAQEIGEDFRISFVGGSNDPTTAAFGSAVACQSDGSECLAVWQETIGDQISGQRIDAVTGGHIGSPFTFSSMSLWGTTPQAAYDPGSNRYLVIWRGYHDVGGGQNEVEVYGQLIDAATGTEVGPDDFRISHHGPAGDTQYQIAIPMITNNPVQGEFLVVWMQEGGGIVRDIALQLVDAATGLEIGVDFTVTDAAGPVSSNSGANEPAVGHDAVNDEYLVTWKAKIEASGTGFEIFGQRLDGSSGAEIGADDTRISFTGIDGVAVDDHQARQPAVAHASATDRWIVVWEGYDDPEPQMALLESEIYMQAIAGGTDTPLGSRIRLSDMGGIGAVAYHAYKPEIVCGNDLECLVAWRGDDSGVGGLVDEEYEVFSQTVNTAILSEVGGNDVRLSSMGGSGNPAYGAAFPDVACIPTLSRYLAVWTGDTWVSFLLGDDEFEAWGQLYAGGLLFSDAFESGDTGGWSSANP